MTNTLSTTAFVAATSAAVIASSANANAGHANCKFIIQEFESMPREKLTNTMRVDYAGCIDTAQPVKLQEGEVLALKAWVIITILAVVIGAVSNRKDDFGGPMMGILMGAIGGLVVSTLAVVSILGLYAGLSFVFGA